MRIYNNGSGSFFFTIDIQGIVISCDTILGVKRYAIFKYQVHLSSDGDMLTHVGRIKIQKA